MINQRAWLGQVSLQQHPALARRQPAQPRWNLGASRRPLLGSAVALTDATFAQVLSAPMAIVDFWSPSCPYCVQYKPVFEDVASQVGDKILMVTANVNDAPEAAGKNNIGGIPATIFYANGKEVTRSEGNMSRDELLAQVNQAFGAKGAAPVATARATPASSGLPTVAIIGGGLLAAGLAVFLATR